ncbi:MAG: CIA30 family protein [Myxococcota bacterium]
MSKVVWKAGPVEMPWQAVTDRVMGGVSEAGLAHVQLDGRWCVRLRGQVSLENNGGFVQMAMNLGQGGQQGQLDGSGWTGLEFEVRGNNETYHAHLRTPAVRRPWQSWRASFVAPAARWTVVRLPWADFAPHRIEGSLDTARLGRLGLVAIGRPFEADLAVAQVALYLERGAP